MTMNGTPPPAPPLEGRGDSGGAAVAYRAAAKPQHTEKVDAEKVPGGVFCYIEGTLIRGI